VDTSAENDKAIQRLSSKILLDLGQNLTEGMFCCIIPTRRVHGYNGRWAFT